MADTKEPAKAPEVKKPVEAVIEDIDANKAGEVLEDGGIKLTSGNIRYDS